MTDMNDLPILRQRCTALSGIGDAELAALSEGSRVIEIQPGEPLYVAGEEADAAYVVTEGRLATLVTRDWGEERVLEEAEVGELVGISELASGDRRLADVRAVDASRVLEIPRRTFEQLLGSHEQAWERIAARARLSICRVLTSKHLNRLLGPSGLKLSDPMLRLEAEQQWLNFEHDVLADLESHIDWVTLRRGEHLFRQNDAAEDAAVLVSGLLQVRVQEPFAGERAVAEVGPGEIVGEIALFTDQARTASLLAMRDCELFRIPRHVFARISEKYPQILLGLYRSSFQRLVRHGSAAAYRPRRPNTAVLAAHADADIADFLDELTTAMAEHGSSERLTSSSVDEALGKAGISDSRRGDASEVRLVQWLNGREQRLDRLVYEAEPTWTGWTDRCVRQADQVLVVADASDERALPSFRERATVPGQSWSLVLVHPGQTDRPRGTAARLDQAGIDSVYHVRRGNRRDLARLARIVCGRAVGLVLGGGGARGCAHIGLLRAMEELGIDVDLVGGTSMGAALAGWVAQGHSADEVQAIAKRTFSSLLDPTLPVTSLLAGRRMTAAIRANTESWDLEDFWLPFFCVSTNLTTATQVVHRRGSALRAIRSSTSIPGVLPPVPDGEALLVDGCVLNNLPIDVMREMNPSGLLIASDVVAPKGLTAKADYGLSVSGWRQATRRLTPWRRTPPTPAVAVVILQSTMVGSELARRRVLERQLADYYQNIHVPGLGMLQFDGLERAVEAGYAATIGPLGEWKASGFQHRVVTAAPQA